VKYHFFLQTGRNSRAKKRGQLGGIADKWVTQLLRSSDSTVFKKYFETKSRMEREASEKINRQANEMPVDSGSGMLR
jgi:hypothetical protein